MLLLVINFVTFSFFYTRFTPTKVTFENIKQKITEARLCRVDTIPRSCSAANVCAHQTEPKANPIISISPLAQPDIRTIMEKKPI